MVNSVLNEQHKKLIEKSVLCWVATVNKDGQPMVSPKEVFELHTNNRLVFAVIASPNTLKNIKQHAKVGVSCLDIWTQKGVQMNGIAEIIDPIHNKFKELEQLLNSKNKDVFKFRNIISIKITEEKNTPRSLLSVFRNYRRKTNHKRRTNLWKTQTKSLKY